MATLPVVGSKLRRLLVGVLVLTGILIIDSFYLVSITFIQWLLDRPLENIYYQYAFAVHLVVGVALIVPVLWFVATHLKRALQHQNTFAKSLGALLAISIVGIIVTGIALTRGIPGFELNESESRELIYWLHILLPLVMVYLFVLHRLFGPRIRWRSGISVLGISTVIAGVATMFLVLQTDTTEELISFEPSLTKLRAADYVEPNEIMIDDYCKSCHEDVHAQWSVSAHRFASFNNPAYAFSVNQTRAKVLARDDDVAAARFCAGCHDPVPLYSGLFDHPEIDFNEHPTGQAGITCMSCHAIESVDSVRGNADFTFAIPEHYPFAMSDSEVLSWFSDVLLKGKPSFHKQSFLKDFHREPEFCGTCHKVHLPEELNHYKWLRGQNHYDSFLLSGFSGHSVTSFYYPDQAVDGCNGCHMDLIESDDFGAKYYEGYETPAVRGHQFPAANTALQHILGLDQSTNSAHQAILKDSVRADIFAIRQQESSDPHPQMDPNFAPLRPTVPRLEPGGVYVVDVVLRSLTVGHAFTQGTSDSNQIWVYATLEDDKGTTFESGKIDKRSGMVDPYAYFVNAYVIDREGNRIRERNAEDIFVQLYNHQIGPGSAAVVHYRLKIPPTARGEVSFKVTLNYRKFDTHYVRTFSEDLKISNDLPITVIATDEITFPVGAPLEEVQDVEPSDIPEWQRWNDYGIGYLNKQDREGLRDAERAFQQVIELDQATGFVNLARVFIQEGRLDAASEALKAALDKGAYPWSVAWFSSQVDLQNGRIDAAISNLEQLIAANFAEAQRRGFDFSKDYRAFHQLALAYFERSKQEEIADNVSEWLEKSAAEYRKVLRLNPEYAAAHYGLSQVLQRLGDTEKAEYHSSEYERYRIDDNARDSAVSAARLKDPAANFAAEAVVIYDLVSNDPLETDATL